jgi:cell division inhibitor SulA
LRPISGVDQARWMTLLEALEYIQSVEKLDPVAAQVRLGKNWFRSSGLTRKDLVTSPTSANYSVLNLLFRALVLL